MAQMNVLESEAYTLEAPILKTIQGAMEEKTEPGAMASQPEQTDDQIVHPIPPVQKPVSDNLNMEGQEKEEKKVYVDGRGQVLEVHEFREVSSPGAQRDIFDDDFERSSSKDFSDDFSGSLSGSFSEHEDEEKPVSEKAREDRNPDEFFKLYDSSSSKVNEQSLDEEDALEQPMKEENGFDPYETSFENPMQDDFTYKEPITEDENTMENSVDPSMEEQMRRIEQLQHERLRQEEARQEELAKASMKGYDDYSAMKFEMDNDNNDNNISQVNSFEEREIHTNDIGMSGNGIEASESYLSLSDIKRMDEEENSSVPLPKASEKQEEYFGQMSSNPFAALHDEGQGEDFNTLSYELDHSRGVSSDYKEKEGFKSFRDFESEL